MQPVSDEVKSDLIVRLRRVEGQIRGVQRMLDTDRDCYEVLQQLAAIRAALQKASGVFARHYAMQCIVSPEEGLTDDELIDRLVTILSKA